MDSNPRNGLFGRNNKVGADVHQEAAEGLLEQENNEAINQLSSKVDMLKSLSIDIGREAKSQNRFLDEMDNEMGSASNLMSGTMKQLGDMMNSGGSKHMCYLVVFIFAFFLLVYWMIRG